MAENAYTSGLDQFGSNSSTFLLHLNRAANRLALERYAGALEDATQAVDLMLASEPNLGTPEQLRRGLFRKAQALYAMRQWSSALSAFEELCSRFPDSLESRRGRDRAQCRLDEQKTGVYDILKLYQEAQKSLRLDVASFCGPVEKKPSSLQDAGQGFFATSDISPGDLIVADKALVAVSPQEVDNMVTSFNLLTGFCENASQTQLRPELAYIQRFQHASTRGDVHQLFSADPSEPSPEHINAELNELAATYNSFGTTTDKPVGHESGAGLFVNACYFNHSCEPNAIWVRSISYPLLLCLLLDRFAEQ